MKKAALKSAAFFNAPHFYLITDYMINKPKIFDAKALKRKD